MCPCILYSRTSYRLNAKDKHHDPTDLLGFEKVNLRCLLSAGTMFCGLHCTFLLALGGLCCFALADSIIDRSFPFLVPYARSPYLQSQW